MINVQSNDCFYSSIGLSKTSKEWYEQSMSLLCSADLSLFSHFSSVTEVGIMRLSAYVVIRPVNPLAVKILNIREKAFNMEVSTLKLPVHISTVDL